jgi:hypothetical protein
MSQLVQKRELASPLFLGKGFLYLKGVNILTVVVLLKIKHQAMIELKDTTPAEKDGKYQFELHYSGREVNCLVEKEQQMLHVTIDDNITAELKINNDNTLTQTGGTSIPDSSIDFIKKKVLGLQV